MDRLAGRVALITGAARGIGAATAQRLARDGAAVAVVDLAGTDTADTTRAITEAGGRALGLGCDVAVAAQVETAVQRTIDELGGLDILVNNAGVGRLADVADQSTTEWHEMIETNLTGVFYCCRAAIPYMKRRGGGWIVSISSLASQNPFAGGACYSATKAGLNAFSHALMQEVRHHGIRVSVVAPGSVDTNFIPREGDRSADTSWKLSPDDVALTVVDLLGHPARSLPSMVHLRPSRPKS
jgi:3-oxoacyl-[acyl-carrier protein] reductase